ncbi:MAG: DegT/DnrJ/EryC1/StrS family aminotransferase, partial [Actinobacteria bacterium]|nr:DegT/DnrJ/EryC1/StrS family aminotransferase [Actinomycetota bacterium]
MSAVRGRGPEVVAWPSWPQWDGRELDVLRQVLASGNWGGYAEALGEFERAFGERHAARHCIGAMNGTVSLVAAFAACEIGAGDEVIVPAYTFFATASAVRLAGATPVFVDIDPDTYNLDVGAAEAAIGERTKAIVPMHFAGLPVDLDLLLPLAEKHGLVVIEDAAHAHGSSWRGRPVGALGRVGSFSFQANKNMTAGEGGALLTNDAALAERLWSYVNQGRSSEGSWYEHPHLGSNLRLTGWQAAVLQIQLDRLDGQLERRMKSSRYLHEELAQFGGLRPLVWDERADNHAHHLFVLRYGPEEFGGLSRAEFCLELEARGIPSSAGYGMPLYRQQSLTPPLSRVTPCPAAEAACGEAIWLSQNLLLAEEAQLAAIPEAVDEILNDRRRLVP